MRLHRLAVFLVALWWGAMSGMAFIAVPLMFAKLGPAVAGPVAAQLFSVQCWLGLGLGMVLLLLLQRQREAAVRARTFSSHAPGEGVAVVRATVTSMGIVLLAMLLAAVQEFGVAQKIVTARATGADLRVWHTLGSATVLGQWLCTAWLLWRLTADQKQEIKNH